MTKESNSLVIFFTSIINTNSVINKNYRHKGILEAFMKANSQYIENSFTQIRMHLEWQLEEK
jgi:hypothetical protein